MADFRPGPPGDHRGPHDNRADRERSEKPFLRKGSIVYILIFLQHGRMDQTEQQARSIFQSFMSNHKVPNFHLFEIELNKGANVAIQDKVVITGEEGPLGTYSKAAEIW